MNNALIFMRKHLKISKYEKMLFLILIFSLALKIQMPEKRSLWWDEAVYLGLAENIYSDHIYHFNIGNQEQFRPPLLPVLIAILRPFFGSFEGAGTFLTITASLVSIAMIYYIIAKMYNNKKYGILASFIMATNTEYIFWSSKILTESLSVLIVSASLYLFYIAFEKNKKEFYPYVGVLTALAFLLRYSNGLLFPFFIIYAVYRKGLKKLANREVLLGLFAFLLLLMPWVGMNYKNYGNPLGGAIYNLNLINHTAPWHMPLFYLSELVAHLQVLAILLFVGLFVTLRKRRKKDVFFAMWMLVVFLFFSLFVGQKHFRYILISLPSITVMSICGVNYLANFRKKKYEKIIVSLLVIAMMIFACFAYHISYKNMTSRISLRDAAEYIRARAPKNCYIIGQSYPMLYYYTKCRVINYPKNQDEVSSLLKNYNISFIVYENSEPCSPYVENWLKNDESLVKVFEKREGNYSVKVYKYGPGNSKKINKF